MKLLSLFLLFCLVQVSLAYRWPNVNYTFYIPATDDASSCESYDLSKLASLGGINFTYYYDTTYNYTLSVCVDVDPNKLPDVCKGAAAAPAYMYKGSSCIVMGRLNSSYVFPVDPTNSSAGIRIGYNNGDQGYEYWPRAVIYDFICDPSAGEGAPRSVAEYPEDTFKIRWHTAYACPGKRVQQSCPLPQFDNTWNTLRFRPRPSWYDNVKFGIFLHWGVFSVPSFMTEWYWKKLEEGTAEFVEFHNRVYGCSGVMPETFPCTGPNFTYPEFAEMFKAELFDPDAWADLFKKAGAKYVVLTSKHHEGWCNFKNSYHWNWNSLDVGPKRDLVGDLTASVRAAGLHMGLYHSLREWYNPLYILDQKDNCSTTSFVDQVILPTLHQLVEQYSPDLIWSDGPGDAPCTHDSIKYWKAPQFLSWLYNESPVKDIVVVDNRWGDPKFGDYSTGRDRFSPGRLIPYKWESAFTIQKTSWGYDRTGGIDDYWNTTHLVYQLVSSVSCNGNLLLNVGPTHDGRIVPAFEERLLGMGAWLEINGEAIYDSIPWRAQSDTDDKQTWYTASKDGITVYAMTFSPPTPGSEFLLHQPEATSQTQVYLLGYNKPLEYTMASDGLHIKFPIIGYGTLNHAWTFRMTYVK